MIYFYDMHPGQAAVDVFAEDAATSLKTALSSFRTWLGESCHLIYSDPVVVSWLNEHSDNASWLFEYATMLSHTVLDEPCSELLGLVSERVGSSGRTPRDFPRCFGGWTFPGKSAAGSSAAVEAHRVWAVLSHQTPPLHRPAWWEAAADTARLAKEAGTAFVAVERLRLFRNDGHAKEFEHWLWLNSPGANPRRDRRGGQWDVRWDVPKEGRV